MIKAFVIKDEIVRFHPQVRQYVSRAEELKALLASDNKQSFEEARTSRDILRGKEQDFRVDTHHKFTLISWDHWLG